MVIRKIALCLSLIIIPTFSYAHEDIVIQNNTGSFGTATLSTFIATSPCSSKAGSDMGILKPNSPLTVPKIALDIFCGFLNCEAHVYATQNCSGPEVAVLSITNSGGVTNIQNYDSRFKLSGRGQNVTVDTVSMNLFQRLMSWV